MCEVRKSSARIKFVVAILVGWASAAAMLFSDLAVLNLVLVLVFTVCALAVMLIRCEICGTLLYRTHKKDHGFPSLAFLFPAEKCPVCGVERH